MTEKQYRVHDFLKRNPEAHTAKDIALALGRIRDRYTYAKAVLAKMELAGSVERIELPCQPVRWKWNSKNDNVVA